MKKETMSVDQLNHPVIPEAYVIDELKGRGSKTHNQENTTSIYDIVHWENCPPSINEVDTESTIVITLQDHHGSQALWYFKDLFYL
jgi:hypothetical protein